MKTTMSNIELSVVATVQGFIGMFFNGKGG
jgi:hypothetical protein